MKVLGFKGRSSKYLLNVLSYNNSLMKLCNLFKIIIHSASVQGKMCTSNLACYLVLPVENVGAKCWANAILKHSRSSRHPSTGGEDKRLN